MTKYKEYVKRMLEENKEVFDAFERLHDQYTLEPDKWQEEFNKKGKEIMKVVREYEDRLCRQSEKGGYSAFTGGLAEKFQNEVRKKFPQIDRVGIITTKKPATPAFSLKKINLS